MTQKEKEYHKAYNLALNRSFYGHIKLSYYHMKYRTMGKGLARRRHSYMGLPLLSWEDFYEWAKNDIAYKVIFDQWVSLNYDIKFSPSIDRINSTLGYIPINIRWLPHWLNCRLGRLGKKKIKNVVSITLPVIAA